LGRGRITTAKARHSKLGEFPDIARPFPRHSHLHFVVRRTHFISRALHHEIHLCFDRNANAPPKKLARDLA
jgi:hypothetical protein